MLLQRYLTLTTATALLFAAGPVLASAAQVKVPEKTPFKTDRLSYSLDSKWNWVWHRFLDRTGKPVPNGSLLQNLAEQAYPEYEFELYQSQFPLGTERMWAESPRGARFYVQSVDEFTLANATEIKTRTPMIGDTYLGLDFDRFQSLNAQHNLFRVDFGYQEENGLLLVHSFYPRWEKTDSDMQSVVGYRFHKLGQVSLRLFYLDPFTNASLALAESRDDVIPEKVKQLDPSLANALEIKTNRFFGLRAEAYLGRLYPSKTRFTYLPAEKENNHTIKPEVVMAGGLLEQRIPALPLAVGVHYLHTATKVTWDYENDPEQDRTREEGIDEVRLYVLYEPRHNISLESFVQFTARPEVKNQNEERSISDDQWLFSIRGTWMFTSVFGFELGHLHLARDRSDSFGSELNGTSNRFLTRFVFQFGPKVWSAFGVGWDTDSDANSIYDGAGLTMTAEF